MTLFLTIMGIRRDRRSIGGSILTGVLGSMICIFPLAQFCNAVEALPNAPPAARYAGMKEKCPFAVATAPAAPEAPKASFAANWYVSGIGRLGGEDFVSIKARDLSAQFSLYGSEADAKTGVALVSIKWEEAVGKSTVVLRKGSETAQLEFNEAEVHATSQPAGVAKTAANGQTVGAPGATAPPGAGAKATASNGVPHPPQRPPGPVQIPAISPNVPRNPAIVSTTGPNGAAGPAQPAQRRVIVPQIQAPH